MICVYGPPGGDKNANTTFFEKEVFSILYETSFDKEIIVEDWNVFLDPTKDQEKFINQIYCILGMYIVN